MQTNCATGDICESSSNDAGLMTHHEAAKVLQAKADALAAVSLTLEGATNEFLRAVDQYKELISQSPGCEMDGSDPIETFGRMRNVLKPSLAGKGALSTISKTCSMELLRLNEKIAKIQRHINKSAMHCGLKRIPDELLSKILEEAGVYWFRSLVRLSQVCKRFRSIIIRNRKLWQGCLLSSSDASDKILFIAERSGFQSLKAFIRDKSLGDSAKTILDLHGGLEELEIYSLPRSTALAMRLHLKDLSFPDLRRLSIKYTDSIPGLEFPGPCYMPHLWNLDIGFIPHPSLARNLIRFSLYRDSGCRLKDLLEFLASTTILEELEVSFRAQFMDQESASALDPIFLPHLVRLYIRGTEATSVISWCTLTEKIPPVEKLELHARGADICTYLSSIQTNMSIRELYVTLYFESVVNVGRILSLLPRRTEVFVCHFQFAKIVFEDSNLEEFPAQQLRIVRFLGIGTIPIATIRSVHNFFDEAVYNSVSIEFQGHIDRNNDSNTLDEVESTLSED